MMEAALEEDRQCRERRAMGLRDDVSRRRQLADVEGDIAHHLAEGEDLRLHFLELERDPLRRDFPLLERRGVPIRAQGDGQVQTSRRFGTQGASPRWQSVAATGPRARRIFGYASQRVH